VKNLILAVMAAIPSIAFAAPLSNASLLDHEGPRPRQRHGRVEGLGDSPLHPVHPGL